MTKPKSKIKPTEAEVESALDDIMTRKGHVEPDSEVINSPAISTNDDIEHRLERIKHLVDTISRTKVQLEIEGNELLQIIGDIRASDYYIREGYRLLLQGIEYAKESKENK